MKFEIARLKRRGSRLAVAWLSIVWSSVALAQSTAPPVPSPNPEPVAAAPAPAPAAAARRTMTVEERLQKLEGMNQRLLEQNQQLTHELKAVTQKVNAPGPPGVQRRLIPVVQPPAGDTNAPATQPTTGSAFGGGELMAPPSGPAPPGPGPGANILFTQPMSGSAFGGGELMAAPSGPEPPGIGGVGANVLRGVPSVAGRRRRRRSHLLRRKGHPRHRGDRAVREEVRQQRPLVLFAEQEFSVPPRRANPTRYYVVPCGQYRSVRPQRDRQAPRRHRPPPLTPPVRRGDVREYTVRLRI